MLSDNTLNNIHLALSPVHRNVLPAGCQLAGELKTMVSKEIQLDRYSQALFHTVALHDDQFGYFEHQNQHKFKIQLDISGNTSSSLALSGSLFLTLEKKPFLVSWPFWAGVLLNVITLLVITVWVCTFHYLKDWLTSERHPTQSILYQRHFAKQLGKLDTHQAQCSLLFFFFYWDFYLYFTLFTVQCYWNLYISTHIYVSFFNQNWLQCDVCLRR